VKEFSKSVNS